MSNDEKSRKDKVVDSYLDTGTDSMIDWGNQFISENLPKAMNWTVEKIKEGISSIAKSSGSSVRSSTHKWIFECIQIGEANKERAMLIAMKEAGIPAEQIQGVLRNHKKYLVTESDYEKDKAIKAPTKK